MGRARWPMRQTVELGLQMTEVTEFKHCYCVAISVKRIWAVKSGEQGP